MKALPASVQVVLFAGILSSCSHLTMDSVRQNYVDSAAPAVPGQPPTPPKLDVKCMTLPGNDEAAVTSALKAQYDLSWRIATGGSHGMDLFVCFERPAGIIDPDVPAPRKRHHSAAPPPPPPAATTDDAAPAASDDAPPPKPRPPRHRPALDADTTTDDSASPAAPPASDDSSDSPPPKKKHRPPPTDDSGN